MIQFCDSNGDFVGYSLASYAQIIDPVTCDTSYVLQAEYFDTDWVSQGQTLPAGWEKCCCESTFVETITTLANTIVGHKIGDYTNENSVVVDLNETVTSLAYNAGTNELTFTDESGTATVVDLTALAVDINVASLTYNPVTGEIVLTETDGTTHVIDIGPVAYTVSDTNTIDMSLTGNDISGIVKIDPDPCNIITTTPDGLISKPERYMQIQDTSNGNLWFLASAADAPRVIESANDCATEPITFLIQGDTTGPGTSASDVYLDRPKVYPGSDTVVVPQLKVGQASSIDGTVRSMSASPVGTLYTAANRITRVSKPTMCSIIGEGEAFTTTPITQTVPFEEFQWAYDLYIDGVYVQGGNQLFQLKNNLITPGGSQMLCNTWGSFFFQTILQPGANRSIVVRMRVAINSFAGSATNSGVQWMKSEHRMQVLYV